MNKKKIAIVVLGIIAIIAVIISATSCTPTEETPSTTLSPAEQVAILNTQVTNIQSGIANLQSDINKLQSPTAINSRVDTLEDNVGSLSNTVGSLQSNINSTNSSTNNQIEALNSSIATLTNFTDDLQVDITNNSQFIANFQVAFQDIEAELDYLQIQIDALPTETGSNYDAEIATINQQITNLSNTISSINSQISSLQSSFNTINGRLSIAEAEIATIQADIDQIAVALTTFDVKASNWDAMVNEWNSTGRVIISEFIAGSNHLKFKTTNGGDYVVVMTLYGTGLDLLAINESVLEFQGVELVDWNYYGNPRTMAVIILQPKTITTTTSGTTYPSWVDNQETQIDFGIGIDYATITTGVR